MNVQIKGIRLNSYDTTSAGARVYKISDTVFDFISTVSFSVVTEINWITDPGTILASLEEDDLLENPSPGSYSFVMLQNKNYFHLHQNTLGKFFNNAGKISGAIGSNIQPHFIYIDEAVRSVDSNFHNKDTYVGSLRRAYSPRWFGFIPQRKKFITENTGSNPAFIQNPGWRDEVNNVYDADCILANSAYPDDSYLFKVARGDEDGDDFSSASESAYNITTELKNPMKVWMSVSPTSGGSWMMSSGGVHEVLKFGISYIYDEYPYEQESRIFKSSTAVYMSSKADYSALAFEIKCMPTQWPARVIGFSIYVWYLNGEIEHPRWLGRCDFNYEGGWVGQDGIRVGWEADYSGGHPNSSRVVVAGADKMKSVPSVSYKFRNGYEHNLDSGTFRYKTSAIVNGKLYAGNVMQVGGQNHNVVFQDRMLVSPVRKYDVFSPSSELTVTTSDGDEIIALVPYGNKLLQFKRQKLYIIYCGDASGEQVEAIHDYMGIQNIDAVTKFNGGVAWANIHGIYLYDGEQIYNILAKNINLSFWKACLGPSKKASIGYMSDRKELMVYFEMDPYSSPRIDSLEMDQDGNIDTGGLASRSANILVYNFDTDSWAYGPNIASDEVRTNMVDDFNDKLMFGIGEGIVNESHNVQNVLDATSPNYASGEFRFKSMGFWDDTYSHLHFYNQKTSSWIYLGNATIGQDIPFDTWNNQGENGENASASWAGLLANNFKNIISEDTLNDDTDATTDELGNAASPSYYADVEAISYNVDEDGNDPIEH